MTKTPQALVAGALLLGLLVGQPSAADHDTLEIATGSVNGIYYAVGSAICRLLRHDPHWADHPCEPLPTQGSVSNIGHLRWGDAEFAIVQADLQEQAFDGTAPFNDRPAFPELRHVATLHPETLTILQRPGARVISTTHRSDQPPRVFLGIGGSGTRALVRIAEQAGFDTDDFDLARNISTTLSIDAFCRGRLDAIFFIVGHPNDLTNQATRKCGAEIAAADGPVAAGVVDARAHFHEAEVPGNIYPRHEAATPTLGVRATLVADASTPDDLVYAVTRALHEHTAELKRLHLAFEDISQEDLELACNSAPIHPGAQRFFDETETRSDPCR